MAEAGCQYCFHLVTSLWEMDYLGIPSIAPISSSPMEVLETNRAYLIVNFCIFARHNFS